MRKFLFILLCIFLSAISAFATKWSAETLPMEYLRDHTKMVCNPDNVLSDNAVNTTNYMLQSLKQKRGIEAIVVAVKNIEGDDPYQFGMELGRKYGIGSKSQNTGLIIILATEDRSYQILTGNGLEGVLPDAICRRIQNRVMLPELKRGDWDNAILNTLDAITKYVDKDNSLKTDEDEDEKAAMWAGLFALLCGATVLIILLLVNRLQRPKCEKCGKRMKLVSQSKVRIIDTHTYKMKCVYKCPRCGHEHTKYQNINNINNNTTIPPILFGSTSRSGSFGGPIGGSFGGGTFGGGGSGGRF